MKLFIIRVLVLSMIGIGTVIAEPKVLDIDWSTVEPFNQKGGRMAGKSQQLPESLINKVKGVLLPVYMPFSSAYDEKVRVVSSNNFYTITAPLKGASLFVSGDRTYQQNASSIAGFQGASKAQNVDFIRAEGMVNAEFNRHGANYSLSIECAKPDEDVRCTKVDYLQQVYSDLIIIGGKS